MEDHRSSGILLAVSSLPGPYGIGSLGGPARRFVDFLAEAGQHYWQILPLVPPGDGSSPYMSPSAFAGNPYFIDLDLLAKDSLLEPEEYTVLKETPDTLVLANYEDGPGFHQTLLLVVDGPDVLFLHYWGGGARSADVGAAAQARFAEYTAAARGR